MSALTLNSVSVEGRIREITATFAKGELTGLVGPNGSGKSTLLQAAAGVLPSRGDVSWEGQLFHRLNFRDRGQRTAWVPQETHLEFGFSVRSVVAQGRYAHGDDDANVDLALRQMDLEALQDRPVNQLSGGERQRVLLARALANGAPLQLWDEPLAALDPRHALEVMALARAHARAGGTVVLSLHDLRAAHQLDRVLVLHRGALRAIGHPSDVFTPELLRDVFGVQATFKPTLNLELP